jgi:hypothetical protein
VYERRGWLYAWVGYCNSPLNNKNIDYHFLWFFPILGFHINHCVNCVIVVLDLILLVDALVFMLYFSSTCLKSGIRAG